MAANPNGKFRGFPLTIWTNVESAAEAEVESTACWNEINKIKEWVEKYCTYAIFGMEHCPTTGRLHIQSYIKRTTAVTVKTQNNKLRQLGLERFDLRIAKGTDVQNKTYCSKEQVLWEFGTPGKQGERTDLKELTERIANSSHPLRELDEITMDEPDMYHKYGRTLIRVADIAQRNTVRTKKTEGIWIYGPTGVGKSYQAYDQFNINTHYDVKLKDKGWWDGYRQQETVIIDEFRGQFPMWELLRLLDDTPHSVPSRNKEPIPFTSERVYITSCHRPEEVYKNLADGDSIEQLYRRCKVFFKPSLAAPATEVLREGNTSNFNKIDTSLSHDKLLKAIEAINEDFSDNEELE